MEYAFSTVQCVVISARGTVLSHLPLCSVEAHERGEVVLARPLLVLQVRGHNRKRMMFVEGACSKHRRAAVRSSSTTQRAIT
eukprot:12116-Heterococcus_DN1.PRE.1